MGPKSPHSLPFMIDGGEMGEVPGLGLGGRSAPAAGRLGQYLVVAGWHCFF